MAQAYSDPTREAVRYALPDVEVWEVLPEDPRTRRLYFDTAAMRDVCGDSMPGIEPGWYRIGRDMAVAKRLRLVGPFATEAEALAEAQDI